MTQYRSKLKKALELVKSRNVRYIDLSIIDKSLYKSYIVLGYEHLHDVISKNGKYSCTCKYFSLRLEECSHILAVKLFEGEINDKGENIK